MADLKKEIEALEQTPETTTLISQSVAIIRWLVGQLIAWRFSICVSVTIGLIIKLALDRPDDYAAGFATDLDAARNAISIVTYPFEGGIKIDDHGQFVRERVADKSYFKSSNPDIDRAWEPLLHGLNIDLGETEVPDVQFTTYRWDKTGTYFTG
ncbi:hypothetical protein BM1_05169 [Bipolaris maydis]|nr:hypothetical protein BM1_05169 [Bipolaris maydis]